ncbi:MAG: HAMP domain-containing histidine kinase [Verrucomicrobia bacterium]|nr:HAMP domain-containing histidine kinase [Verrucomicrobiota bacterium]
MSPGRLLCCLLALGLGWAGRPGLGAAERELTSVREVVALEALDAGQRPRPVRLRGVVTEVGTSGLSLTLDEGGQGVGVVLGPGVACPALGDDVELSGVTATVTVMGHSHPRVTATTLRVLGRRPLPTPLPLSLATLNRFGHFERWVRIEGHVVRWKFRRSNLELVLLLGGTDDWTTVVVRTSSRPELVAQLMGAKVRLTGINAGTSTHDAFGAFIAPSLEQLEILQPGGSDPFDAPTAGVAEVIEGRIEAGARIRVRGTLLARPGERLAYVRGPEGQAFSAYLLPPFTGNPAQEEFADAGPLPMLEPGDEVEVVGSPSPHEWASSPGGYALHFCHVRVLGRRTPPEPVPTSLTEIAQGRWTHDLVQVQGRLLSLLEVPVERGERRTVMQLEAGGARLPLAYQSTRPTTFDALKVDDAVLVTALVDRAAAGEPRQLRLLSVGDIKSLGISPDVRARRLWLWGGSGALVLMLLGGWIATLRRSAQLQAAAAATLERRVAERTTDLQQAQVELHEALGRERELGELKTRFVSMVSHEFRTPLGVIMSSVELLQHYSARLPEEERRHQLEAIRASTAHMGDLMEKVLVLSRADAGKISFRPQPLDLVALVEKVVDETRSHTAGKCRLTLHAEGDLAGAQGDESLLRHILGNLVANAVKYSPPDAPVEIRLRRDGAQAVTVVEDRGIGIPEKDRVRLFEAFHRGSNVGETPGTGLGLVIVKRCVELHGGRLDFTSAHAGTRFTVVLPLFRTPA